LTYPIIQLPFEMTKLGSSAGFFRNNLLWVGFGVAAGINLIKGLHFLYPAVPDIPFIKDYETYNLGSFFTSKPMNAIGDMPVTIMVSIVGLVFLFLLSCLSPCGFLSDTSGTAGIGSHGRGGGLTGGTVL